MSGGSLDYADYKISEWADRISDRYKDDHQMQAFTKFLRRFAVVMHNIEWEISGDATMTDAERAEIQKIIGKRAALNYTIEEAKRIEKELHEEIESASNDPQ